ncbi:hypothetical protein BDZ94DRAFT_83275 [Collybia nuda]|uniref:F-box domain-containing protein n=1 Tax=Collybia nuda TaxID=64659 RepID=A0A9P6CAM1_9AGAR|nr:hypothetical protein BDZ94DRAFT_83275 [Collybia nuda]
MTPQSPFHGYPALVLSPNIPSDADASSAREQIKIAENELHKLDLELSLILARRSVIMSHINRCRMVIAPYKKLPSELIRKIIVLCVPEVESENATPGKEYYSSRLRVTQICTTWRKIAFDESALWDVSIYPLGRLVDLAESWFRQSSCSSLGLTVRRESVYTDTFNFGSLSPVVNRVITPYSKRLKTLGMIVNESLLKSVLSLTLDSLLSMSLVLDYKDDEWKVSDLPISKPTPSLRSLTLSIPPGFSDERFFLALPLPQLSRIKLTSRISASIVPGILGQCHSLEECTIIAVYQAEFSTFPTPKSSIFLPHLRKLTILFGSYDAEPLLCSFEVPNLSSLMTNIDFSSPRFRSFFRQLSNIHCITIHGIGIRGSFIDENILSSIPNLVMFRTGPYPIPPLALIKIGTGDLLPKVEHLKFPESNRQFILDMLNARSLAVQARPGEISPIKRIVINGAGVEGTYKESFDILRSQGTEINFV